MIHNVSGSNPLAFGSFYDEPVSADPLHLISRLQLVHTKSVDQLYSYPCEIHLELTQGIASLLVGSSPRLEELRTFPIHHYVKLKPNTYFNLIVHSEEIVCNLITPNVHPTAVKLAVPYLYQPFFSPFNVLEIFDSYVSEVTEFHFHSAVHDYYELFYVIDGSLTLNMAGDSRTIEANDLIICGPHQSYPRQISSDTLCNYLTVVFDMGNAERIHFLGQTFSCSESIHSALDKLIAQSLSHSYYTQTLMLCYLQEVITQLMQLTDTLLPSHSTPTSQQNFQNDLLQQILAYMNKKVAEPMTVEEICHKFFISRSSLQSLFKAHLHTSPKNHLINIKLQKSKELIQENRHTISEIAYLLGFSSIHYFSRLFKKYYNMSPSEYAKQVSEMNKSEALSPPQTECYNERSE
ncbi:AraC family transcriptional regulator [Butyricicoccus pullicaecorum]|uniref:AraC family transcriptional regulator n=1 Tax=Butyricicoccus pullicaecorum TaxID=501571 RepID=UPI003521372E